MNNLMILKTDLDAARQNVIEVSTEAQANQFGHQEDDGSTWTSRFEEGQIRRQAY